MDTETKNRRQRIDEAEAALSQAHSRQADAEARSMKAVAESDIAQARVIEATKATDQARGQLADALSYVDQPVAKPAPVNGRDGDDDEIFEDTNQPAVVG